MGVAKIIVILVYKVGTQVFILLLFFKHFYMYDIFHKEKNSHENKRSITNLIPKFIQESGPV